MSLGSNQQQRCCVGMTAASVCGHSTHSPHLGCVHQPQDCGEGRSPEGARWEQDELTVSPGLPNQHEFSVSPSTHTDKHHTHVHITHATYPYAHHIYATHHTRTPHTDHTHTTHTYTTHYTHTTHNTCRCHTYIPHTTHRHTTTHAHHTYPTYHTQACTPHMPYTPHTYHMHTPNLNPSSEFLSQSRGKTERTQEK